MKAVLSAVALAVAGLFMGMVGLVAVRGAGALTWSYLFGLPARSGLEGGILPALVNTAWLVGGSLTVALPIGVGTAVYLREYAAPGPLVQSMRTLIGALAGVPSIIFGLFGYGLFVDRLGWGWSLASGMATLALMLLPTIIQTAEEALAAVPAELREGAAALGAANLQVLRRVVLPVAAPGIATGAILAMGRAFGESAAVLLTAGGDLVMPRSPLSPGRPLAVHLYLMVSERLSDERAYATALVLVLVTLAVNLAAHLTLARRRHGR